MYKETTRVMRHILVRLNVCVSLSGHNLSLHALPISLESTQNANLLKSLLIHISSSVSARYQPDHVPHAVSKPLFQSNMYAQSYHATISVSSHFYLYDNSPTTPTCKYNITLKSLLQPLSSIKCKKKQLRT